MKSSARFNTIYTKATKYREASPTEYEASVVAKKVIIIRKKNDDGSYTNPKIFKIGDMVEYDSYNLRYIGKITAIGAKTITVDKNGKYDHIDRVDNTRMDLYKFAWRNYNLDLGEIARQNADTMMYI